jgi:hypothetical protein
MHICARARKREVHVIDQIERRVLPYDGTREGEGRSSGSPAARARARSLPPPPPHPTPNPPPPSLSLPLSPSLSLSLPLSPSLSLSLSLSLSDSIFSKFSVLGACVLLVESINMGKHLQGCQFQTLILTTFQSLAHHLFWYRLGTMIVRKRGLHTFRGSPSICHTVLE